MPVPTYPGLRLALPSRRRDRAAHRERQARRDPHRHRRPDRPRVRAYCLRRNWPFTTSYTTRFPEYIAARWPIPEGLIYAGLRRFHAAASVTMIATPSLEANCGTKASGISAAGPAASTPTCSGPNAPSSFAFPRPMFACVGRIAVEKNLEAFLSLDLPGTKIVIGTGPQEAELQSALSRGEIPRPDRERRARRSSCGGRRVRVPEPHRHVRRRAARGARVRRADRGVSGHRPEGRGRRSSGRRAERRSPRGLPRRAQGLARPAATSRLQYSWENSARQFIGHLRDVNTGRLARTAPVGDAVAAHG